jgi:hypothetical protein
MKKTVLKFGLFSAITSAIIFGLALILGKNLDFKVQEILGYLSIVISLTFVFFAIKHYRDQVNNGIITLGKALVIGLLISLFAAIAFGIVDAIYMKYINPDFTDQYLAYTLENLEKTLPEEDFKIKKTEIESQMAAFSNPAMASFVMFTTVFMIGIIISLLSALILKKAK